MVVLLWNASSLVARPRSGQGDEGAIPANLARHRAKAYTIKCRSWLACDSITSVYLMDRVVCIAGKPAPTGVLRQPEI
ncbi:hypothetical protein TU75_02095 [Pseudomonas poae]|nr:hypothetical protein TU75_02095 [Pseudomonas poae]